MNTELIIQNITAELSKFTILGLPGMLVAPITGMHHTSLGKESSILSVIITQSHLPSDAEVRQAFYQTCTELHQRFSNLDINALLGINPLEIGDEGELFYKVYNTDWSLILYKNKVDDTVLLQFTDTCLVITVTQSGIDKLY